MTFCASIRRTIRHPLTWITLLVIGFAVVLAVRPSEAWFGVPGEWTWSGRPPSPSTYGRWFPAIAALIGVVVGAVVLDRHWDRLGRCARLMALFSLVVAVPLIQVSLKYIHYRYPLEFYLYRTIGPHNGFWQAAAGIPSLADYLRAYPQAMRDARATHIHLATHPPGAVIYLWAWRQFFAAFGGLALTLSHHLRAYACADLGFVTRGDAAIAATVGQMIVPLWSGLAVLPVYALGKRLGGRRDGWRAATLYALLPTLSLFTMRWDTLYPLFTATAFLLLHLGVVTRRARWWYASGLVVSVASFFSFGNALLAPTVALFAVLSLYLPRRRVRDVLARWRSWVALLVGGYTVWAVFRLFTGVSVWELLAITSDVQHDLRAAYSYGRWLVYNLVDIGALSGFSITVPYLIVVFWAARSLVTKSRRPLPVDAAALALAVAAVILGIDLAGLSPGEVARLWLHFTVPMIVLTVMWLRHIGTRRTFAWLLALMAFQGLWLSLFLRVSATGMPSYRPRQVDVERVAPTPVAQFERGMALVDATVVSNRIARGGTLQVALTWYAQRRTDRPFTVFVHLVGQEGRLVAQDDGMPLDGTLPTTCWVPGEIVRDVHSIKVPAGAAPGPHAVLVGWYDLATLGRVPLVDPVVPDAAFELPGNVEISD